MAQEEGLVLHSTVTVETPEGPRLIQLMFGDITKLPMQDKVDFIMVSAFAGDYAATRTSLIGALKYNLNLSVRDLARDKKEDLRQYFHCWRSHPLPENLPYGQLVCFETPVFRGFRHPSELVGDVFRALIPMFGDQECSVITPLLSTGDQGFDRAVMLKSMLDAAVNWILAGLPMKCLKIVLYKRDPSWLSTDEKKLVEIFDKFKEKMERKTQAKKAEAKFDVYLCYSAEDKERVMEISKLMLKEHKKLRIFKEEQHVNSEIAFQENILDTMKTSLRVVTILSPAFLGSSECVEKYNLALCVNRKSRKNILAPFYIETISAMPTYMTLVQYVDVRNRDGTNQRLFTGVHTFVESILVTVQMTMLRPLTMQYDVFISYSHRNNDKANQLLSLLQKLDPNLSIFFDRKELKTGFSWQQTLYHAIDNSKVMVALLSPDYVTSQVCSEEYCIALCRHLTETEEERLELVPIMIESCDSLPRPLTKVPFLDGTKDFSSTLAEVTRAVINYHTGKEKNMNVFNDVQEPLNLSRILSQSRAEMFKDKFDIRDQNIFHKELNYEELADQAAEYRKTDDYKRKLAELEEVAAEAIAAKQKELEQLNSKTEEEIIDHTRKKNEENLDKIFDVAFISADHLHGAFLNSLLHTRAPQLDTDFYVNSHEAELTALEKAKLCVVLFSPKMLTVSKDMEEVDVALARHRKSASQPVIYPIIVGNLPSRPTFCHLVPCQVSLRDPLWVSLMSETGISQVENLPEDLAQADKMLNEQFNEGLSLPAMLGLSAACDDIISIFYGKNKIVEKTSKNVVIDNVVALHMKQTREVDTSTEIPAKEGGWRASRGNE